MSFTVKKSSLPVWHKDYDSTSTTYVDPFALNPASKDANVSTKYTAIGKNYLKSMGDFNVGSEMFKVASENGLVYKGCGLLYETTSNYTSGWQTDVSTGNTGVTDRDPDSWADSQAYYAEDKHYHITRTSDGTLSIYRINTAYPPVTSANYLDTATLAWTYQNVPPLVYFELCAAGGGGAGCVGNGGGGGGGGGAGCCGILNFTSEQAHQNGFILTLGSSGYGSNGAYAQDPDSMPGTTATSNGAGGHSSYLRLNSTDRYDYLLMEGGRGGQAFPRGDAYSPTGGSGGKPYEQMYLGANATSNQLSDLSNNKFIDSAESIYLLYSTSGVKGGAPCLSKSNTPTEAYGTYSGSTIKFNNSLTLNIIASQSIYQEDTTQYYDGADPAKFGGGWGGASMLGGGGQNGSWVYNTGRGAKTPAGYGGGGGGANIYSGSGEESGAPGAPAVFKMYWVPMTDTNSGDTSGGGSSSSGSIIKPPGDDNVTETIK